MHQGVNNSHADIAVAAPIAASTWRLSKGGLQCTGQRPRRCNFGHDARSSSALSSRRGSSSWDEEASTAAIAAGKDIASPVDRRPNEGLDPRRDGGSDDNPDADPESSAAAFELEPLVERVASALEQRCSVRGGDLVRSFVLG